MLFILGQIKGNSCDTLTPRWRCSRQFTCSRDENRATKAVYRRKPLDQRVYGPSNVARVLIIRSLDASKFCFKKIVFRQSKSEENTNCARQLPFVNDSGEMYYRVLLWFLLITFSHRMKGYACFLYMLIMCVCVTFISRFFLLRLVYFLYSFFLNYFRVCVFGVYSWQ